MNDNYDEDAPTIKPENDVENELRRRAPWHYRPADLDDAPTIPCDRSGGTILAGRYHVLRKLGGGGMGDVYLAEDAQLDNKLFAIKMLPSVLASDKRAYRQLKEEALMAMKLTHPNIVTLRAFEENGGNPFLVMDYVDGETLGDLLADKGKLSAGETAVLLKPVAAALDYAHSQKVVHRDIKPGNVLVRKDGVPFVLDFGIAREIHETMTRVTGRSSGGTLLYMSPEQLNGASPKPAQDVYSFAAMAYECMKGDPPFVRGNIEHQIENKPPEPLPGGTPIAAGVMAGLAKKPEDRPANCMAVIEGNGFSREERAEHVDGVLGTGNGGQEERKDSGVLVAASALVICPVCGKKNHPEDTFKCRECGRDNLCLKHQDEKTFLCADCIVARRAEANRKAEAERLAQEKAESTAGTGTVKTLILPGGAKMDMIYVAPGSFMMGGPESEKGRYKDETLHRVTLTKGFWLGRYPVTQLQWKSVMGTNPSYFQPSFLSKIFLTDTGVYERRPVENVSWNDCQEFIRKVNMLARSRFGGEARLPTEAEWEYACRAGSVGAFAGTGDLDSMGWYGFCGMGNSSPKTHPVGQKSPNAWGFYDMHGNVWEWCNDRYGAYSGYSVTDPAGAVSGDLRVLRGGSWFNRARYCRSASRGGNSPSYRCRSIGFRLACSAEPDGQGAEQ